MHRACHKAVGDVHELRFEVSMQKARDCSAEAVFPVLSAAVLQQHLQLQPFMRSTSMNSAGSPEDGTPNALGPKSF